MNNKMSFEVENFSIIDDISNEQFAIVEVYVCHDGNNAHNMPIAFDVLKKAKDTLRNKFLVAGFNGRDFKGHEPDERIVGFFPESSKMWFEEKNGKNYLVAEAIMSKIYAKWAYDVFLKSNNKDVSMEITVLKTSDKDNTESIEEFIFNGVTILGNTHMPACEGANASIIKFSKENALEVYSNHFSSINIKRKYIEGMMPTKDVVKDDCDSKYEVIQEDEDTTYMEDAKLNDSKNKMEGDGCMKEKMEDKATEEKTTETEVKEEASKKEEKSENVEEKKYSEDETKKEDSEKEEKSDKDDSEKEETKDEEKKEESKEEKMEDKEEDSKKEEDMSCKEDMEAIKKENSELKEKVAKYEAAEKTQAVESILAEVATIFSAEEMESLRTESNNFSLENLNSFENEVKAKAFEAVKTTTSKEKKNFTKMEINNLDTEKKSKYTW